jgi:hypothetical protein
MKAQIFEIGDTVALHFEEASAIGYNGILCKIKMEWLKNGERLLFCESIYGTAKVWARERNLIKMKPINNR